MEQLIYAFALVCFGSVAVFGAQYVPRTEPWSKGVFMLMGLVASAFAVWRVFVVCEELEHDPVLNWIIAVPLIVAALAVTWCMVSVVQENNKQNSTR